MNLFNMNLLVKKAISPSNLSRPPPTMAPLLAPSTPASRPLYPRFRTLYPRFRTLYSRTPAPPVHPLYIRQGNTCCKGPGNKAIYFRDYSSTTNMTTVDRILCFSSHTSNLPTSLTLTFTFVFSFS